MSPAVTVLVYAAATLVASLIGGWVPLWARRMTHARIHLMMSLVAGLMLGVGVFHMLPHAAVQTGSLDQSVLWLMAGLLATFFLQRFSHFHQHEPPGTVGAPAELQSDPHVHAHHDDHTHHDDHGPARAGLHSLGWTGIAIGLTLHSLMDGMALAASVEAESHLHASGHVLLGVGTFLAVFLHKPLDAMAITAMMLSRGASRGWRHLVNIVFSLVCPLGVGLSYLTLGEFGREHSVVVGCALAFSAGAFLCISLGDLLPELQFHSHDRWKLSAALLLGISLAYFIGLLEGEHLHGGSVHAGEEKAHQSGQP